MISSTMAKSHFPVRSPQHDPLQDEGATALGQQSFEWVLKELTADQAGRSAMSFAATGTLGFERSPASDPNAVDTMVDPGTRRPAANLAFPATDTVPAETPDWKILSRFPASLLETLRQAMGDAGPRLSDKSSTGSLEVGHTATSAHGLSSSTGGDGGADRLSASPSAELSSDASSTSAAHLRDHARSANASRISVNFRPTDGDAATYITLPGWSTAEEGDIRVRARYLLSLYGWPEATLHIRGTDSSNPQTTKQERVYGR